MAEPVGAPTLYRIEMEKTLGSEAWTNVYYGLPEGTGGYPLALVDAILAAERAVTHPTVSFTRTRISSTARGDDMYRIVQHNVAGQSATTGDVMPLFVVARVELGTVQGRPSRKYLRGVLTETEVAVGVVSANAITRINNGYSTPIAAAAGLTDVDGQEIISATVVSAVGMRQLRRRSRSRFDPETGTERQ